MPRRGGVALALLAPLAGCGFIGNMISTSSYDTRWVGTVSPVDGTHCAKATHGTLTFREKDRQVTFAPSDGVVVLPGTLDKDGKVTASAEFKGENKQPAKFTLEGEFLGGSFIGLYTTPACRWHVELNNPHPPPARIFGPKAPLGLGGKG